MGPVGATQDSSSIRQGTVTLSNGDNAVCTIINNDEPGTLQIVKKVVNDDGGTNLVNASDGSPPPVLSFGAGVEDPTDTFTYTATALTVDAGSYTLRGERHRRVHQGHLVCAPVPRRVPRRSPLVRSSCPTAAPSCARSPTTTSPLR